MVASDASDEMEMRAASISSACSVATCLSSSASVLPTSIRSGKTCEVTLGRMYVEPAISWSLRSC